MDGYDIISYMKKLFFVLLCTLLCAGCNRSKSDKSQAANAAYQGYFQAISDNSRFVGESYYYTVNGSMTQMPDGTYRYYIFIEDPQIAMYDITVLAVENGQKFPETRKMMPCIGIFEDTDYSMIPYQVYADEGYVKGVVISGESIDDHVHLDMLVEWKDKNREKTLREYLSYELTTTEFYYDDEISVEVEEETESEDQS